MMNSTRPSAAARVSHAAANALETSTHAMDGGRQFATEAAGKIGNLSADLRESAADLVRSGAESVSDATVAAQRQLGQVARATRRYVGRQPWKSALVAAVVGATATALVVAAFRSPRDRE
jgi:ElaB/YqjD/DUF883 family membrane-anchored ribosome-binding protein